MDFTAEPHPGWCDPDHCTPHRHSSTPIPLPISGAHSGAHLTFTCTRAGVDWPTVDVRVTTATGDVTIALLPEDLQRVTDRLNTERDRLRYLTYPQPIRLAAPGHGDAA